MNKLIAENVGFVHGSNLHALVGVAKLGSLLSANDLDDRNIKPQSGERGYTQAAQRDEPIRNGISMYSVSEYDKSQDYSKMGGAIPVFFGIHPDVPLSEKITEHPLSTGSVGLNQIQKIYIPEGATSHVVADIRQSESLYADDLISRISEFDPIFN